MTEKTYREKFSAAPQRRGGFAVDQADFDRLMHRHFHCRKRRPEMRRELQVVEADDGELLRHLDTQGAALGQRTDGQNVIAADDRGGARVRSRQQACKGGAAGNLGGMLRRGLKARARG